jgi:8-oxo-dGTP diphosphatase
MAKFALFSREQIKGSIMNRPKVGIGVVILNKENHLLLGKRKNAHGAGFWSPPGGHLEYGETFEGCAVREAEEETGLLLENLRVLGVSNDIFEAEGKHYVSIFVRGTPRGESEPMVREPKKNESWHWFPMEQLPDALFLPLQNFLSQHGHQISGIDLVGGGD